MTCVCQQLLMNDSGRENVTFQYHLVTPCYSSQPTCLTRSFPPTNMEQNQIQPLTLLYPLERDVESQSYSEHNTAQQTYNN